MSLSTKQAEFTLDIAKLILWVHHPNGPARLRFREVGRYPWVAKTMAFFKRGIVNSNHCNFLAADMVLDIMNHETGKWEYQSETEDYKFIGEFWEEIREGNCWGGRFNDGNHFSREHNGVK